MNFYQDDFYIISEYHTGSIQTLCTFIFQSYRLKIMLMVFWVPVRSRFTKPQLFPIHTINRQPSCPMTQYQAAIRLDQIDGRKEPSAITVAGTQVSSLPVLRQCCSQCRMSVCYLLGGSEVTCPRGVVAGVGGFRSPTASAVELLPEDCGVCGPWREPPEFATRHKCFTFFISLFSSQLEDSQNLQWKLLEIHTAGLR